MGSCNRIDRERLDREPDAIPPAPPTSVEPTPATWHYVLVRADLPDGIKGAMIAHAAGDSAAMYGVVHGRPLPPHNRVVVLRLPSQGAVRCVAEQLAKSGIALAVVHESEGEFAGHDMAIGIVPTTDRDPIRRLTSQFPLLR